MHKVAVVTGAGSGIGRAVALELLRAGYVLVLCGRRLETLQQTEQLAIEEGIEVTEQLRLHACDVTDENQVSRMFSESFAEFGRIDVLFNNAGCGAPACTIDELSVAQWRSIVDVNLNGMFICAREAFKYMRQQTPQGGRIVNNGSIAAHTPRPLSAAYTATKHAVSGLTKSISLDGRAFAIVCSQIDIGNAATEMTQPMRKGILQAHGQTQVEPTMDVTHVAQAVRQMVEFPLATNVQFMTIMASNMPYIGRG